MDISSGVTDYLSKVNYAKWNVIECLKHLDRKNCTGLVSENKEEILKEIKNHLHLISINQSSNRKARDTAKKLHKNIEKQFQFNETIAFFIQMDEKVNRNIFDVKTNLYGSEVAVQMINDKLTDFQSKKSSLKRSNEETNIVEIKRPCIQKDATFELLTKESLNIEENLIIGNFNVR
ncbi:43587_t:CDS:2, partial [Gigaspora margarita]